MRKLHGIVVVALWLGVLLAPELVYAQASITGVVRDPSGAVLPGVTVEAASDVLIEKVRTAVTDGSGQYRIVDLRAGVYTVTFTLTGFSTVKRDGLELTGLMTAPLSVEMRVGALEETITVTGESPIVDVQSVRRQATIDGSVLASIPTARGYSGVMLLIPAIQVQGNSPSNVQATPGMVVFGTGRRCVTTATSKTGIRNSPLSPRPTPADPATSSPVRCFRIAIRPQGSSRESPGFRPTRFRRSTCSSAAPSEASRGRRWWQTWP